MTSLLQLRKLPTLIRSWQRGLTGNNGGTSSYDVCVIGSGPGGYVAAIRAAQLGLRTACVEKRPTLGGTCLNVGCIPSKSLLHNSQLYYMAKSGQLKKRGVNCDNVSLDLPAMMAQKEQAVEGLTRGVATLFKFNKITRYNGIASIPKSGEVQVHTQSGSANSISAKNIIIATGSTVMNLPGIEINERNVVSSEGALSLKTVPKHMVVIGGGVIGLELGSVWSRLGSKVTVVEMMNSVGGGNVDKEVATSLLRIMKKQGLELRLECKVEGVEEQPDNAIKIKCASNTGVNPCRSDKLPFKENTKTKIALVYTDQEMDAFFINTGLWIGR